MPRSFKPYENIYPLILSAAERQLLLDDDKLTQAIRDTPPDRPVRLTLGELERLAKDLDGMSHRAEYQNCLAEIKHLYKKVDTLLDSFGDA